MAVSPEAMISHFVRSHAQDVLSFVNALKAGNMSTASSVIDRVAASRTLQGFASQLCASASTSGRFQDYLRERFPNLPFLRDFAKVVYGLSFVGGGLLLGEALGLILLCVGVAMLLSVFIPLLREKLKELTSGMAEV